MRDGNKEAERLIAEANANLMSDEQPPARRTNGF